MQESIWGPTIQAVADAAAQIIPLLATALVLYLTVLIATLRSRWVERAKAQTEAARTATTANEAVVHAADVALIRKALETSAVTAASGVLNNTIGTIAEAAQLGVDYARNAQTVGNTVMKVGIPAATLLAMSVAAVTAEVARQRATAPAPEAKL